MKNIYLLGSTGSIGRQVLEIVDLYPDEFKIICLSSHKRMKDLMYLIGKYKPEFVSVNTKNEADAFSDLFPEVIFGYGKTGLIHAATFKPKDNAGVLINALVGISGLHPTVEAIKIKRNILLANKETLVVGGVLIKQLLAEYKVSLYPIDSEHSAIWQCLVGEKIEEVQKVIITASGGAFRDYSLEQLASVTKKEALNHPNWTMGDKITIDSATMMNKGFEVIEAAYLFDLGIDQIDTIIHKESIIHSLVEFKDHSIKAQLSSHDMRLPIQYAMFYPNRKPSLTESIQLSQIGNLNFEKMNEEKYPCFTYAKQAFIQGGSMPCVLNAANEAAVQLFLDDLIPFLEIPLIIAHQIESHKVITSPTLEELLALDEQIKQDVYSLWKVKE
ncbi:MAG: 1-deoxy-D-xylulose-5-phosphate reductoisomerase [Candidatus Izemoplasmatales bacterium]|nr:1-deoxy-D-xylulose-5-phosphate reductoisomerase [Candidatus Izemoplasmatales bacterium]